MYALYSPSGVDDPKMHDSHIKFWEDVYGFKMNCMKSAVYKEASVTIVDKDYILTDVSCIKVSRIQARVTGVSSMCPGISCVSSMSP